MVFFFKAGAVADPHTCSVLDYSAPALPPWSSLIVASSSGTWFLSGTLEFVCLKFS